MIPEQDLDYIECRNSKAAEYAIAHQDDGARVGGHLSGVDLVLAFFAGTNFRDAYLRAMQRGEEGMESQDKA